MIKLPRTTDSILKNKLVRTELCDDQQERPDKYGRLCKLFSDSALWTPGLSRAVVFVTSRALAEELAQRINDRGIVVNDHRLAAEAFHGRLPTEVKNDIYERFRAQSMPHVDILCATKAFGMGMDIENIHLVVHFGPPNSLEDYIQEIGRAARSESALRTAGLKQATTVLLYTSTDFEKMRVRLHRDLLSGMDLQMLLSAIKSEFDRSNLQLPATIAMDPSQLTRNSGLSTNKVRSGLYWLERLGRIKVGCYAPSQLTLEVNNWRCHVNRSGLSPAAQHLLDQLQLDMYQEIQRISVPVSMLRDAAGFRTDQELFRCLIELESAQIIQGRRLFLPLPRNHDHAQECRACADTMNWPLLNAALNVLEKLLTPCLRPHHRDSFSIPKAKVEGLLSEEKLDSNHYDWLDDWLTPDMRSQRAQRDQKRLTNLGHAIIRLVGSIGIFDVKTQLEAGYLSYTFRQRSYNSLQTISALPVAVKSTLQFIVQSQTVNQSDSNAPGEIDGLKLLGFVARQTPQIHWRPRSIEAILRFLRDLGYIGRTDIYFPIAYEITLKSSTGLDIEDAAPDEPSRDTKVLNELREQASRQIWRLAALEAVTCIANNPADLEDYISGYFSSDESNPIQKALEDQFYRHRDQGLGNILSQARGDAFAEFLNGGSKDPPLSEEQRLVCTARVDRDLMINAGPGAGKTKTLLARLAYLIHEKHEVPERILVLAFTRAVVDELRHRLRDIFNRLGYGGHVQKIAVHTFHSFALSELRRIHQKPNLGQNDQEFDKPISDLVNSLQRDHSLRSTLAARYRYIFVDEFQDVYGVRCSLLKLLAGADPRLQQPPANRTVHFVVAFDDDQAIFEPNDSFAGSLRCVKDFPAWANPDDFVLTRNYRCARSIVDASQQVLDSMSGRRKDQPQHRLKSERDAPGHFLQINLEGNSYDHSEILIEQVRNAKEELERRRQESGTITNSTIAILTPTNEDVYRIKRHLQSSFGVDFSLLVQGEESRFDQRRDVARLVDKLNTDDGVRTRSAVSYLLPWLRDRLQESTYAYWPGQAQRPELSELWHLGIHFTTLVGVGATCGDFADYLYDVSINGNYLQIVAKQQAADESAPGRILLSTIHKVKGLEFPAVILSSSNATFRTDHQVQLALRVLYVGMTRAQDSLVFVCGQRERRLLEGKPYPDQSANRDEVHSVAYRDGIAVKPSLGDVNISFFGSHSKRVELIEGLLLGQPLELRRKDDSFHIYDIAKTNCYFGKLAKANAAKQNLAWHLEQRFPGCQHFHGLEVSGIYRRFAEFDLKAGRESNANFYDSLCSEVKNRGYYHVVEICGFVQPSDIGHSKS